MNRILGLILLLLAPSASCVADGTADSGDVAEDHLLRQAISFDQAHFVQTRVIAALERPLVSSGMVTLSANGFIWHQTVPFDVELAYDGEVLTEHTRVGESDLTRSLDDPITVNVTRTLFQMMSGSWTDIQSSFDITTRNGTADDGIWSVVLVPHDPDIRSVIPRILLDGEAYLNRITVEQADGITTSIELSRQRREE